MDIETQVTSLELSKKLKELGVKQESVWYWLEIDGGFTNPVYWEVHQLDDIGSQDISAFTVAELGEIYKGKKILTYFDEKTREWEVYCPETDFFMQVIFADTEANARALALIWLIENGHVEVKSKE